MIILPVSKPAFQNEVLGSGHIDAVSRPESAGNVRPGKPVARARVFDVLRTGKLGMRPNNSSDGDGHDGKGEPGRAIGAAGGQGRVVLRGRSSGAAERLVEDGVLRLRDVAAGNQPGTVRVCVFGRTSRGEGTAPAVRSSAVRAVSGVVTRKDGSRRGRLCTENGRPGR